MSRGICDRIKNAKHPDEVARALQEVAINGYTMASQATRRRWVRLAEASVKRFESDPRTTGKA